MKIIMIWLFSSCFVLSEIKHEGLASYYSVRSNGGSHTASGEKLNDKAYTAAHPKLPFGTILRITNLSNNKQVLVRINNRGPFATNTNGKAIRPLKPHPERIVDLSIAAAEKLGFIRDGVTKVRIEVVDS